MSRGTDHNAFNRARARRYDKGYVYQCLRSGKWAWVKEDKVEARQQTKLAEVRHFTEIIKWNCPTGSTVEIKAEETARILTLRVTAGGDRAWLARTMFALGERNEVTYQFNRNNPDRVTLSARVQTSSGPRLLRLVVHYVTPSESAQ
jgi:hypothetical protein